jgi:hypothetical protein
MAAEFYAIWDGNTLRPEMGMDRDEAAALPIGKRLKIRATMTRSPAHHRALFGALEQIRKHQWPANHDYQPGSKEEFRAWVTVKAKYRSATFVDISSQAELEALKVVYKIERRNGNFVWMMKIDGKIAIVRPASIDWDTLDQIDFAPVFNAIADVIMNEAGISIDDVIEYLRTKDRRQAA